jgi:hypothetical protein
LTATRIGTAPDDFTNGGAVQWVNDTTIRVLFGPEYLLACSTSFAATVYVSNDPGRGISGDATSAGVAVNFTNTIACPTPTPDPTILTSAPSVGNCGGTNQFSIQGTGFDQGGVSVQFGPGNPASGLSVSPTSISGQIPPASAISCPSFACNATTPPCGASPLPAFTCTVDVIVTVGGKQLTIAGGYTYQSSTSAPCTAYP